MMIVSPKVYRRIRCLLCICLALVFYVTPLAKPAQSQGSFNPEQAQRASVHLMQVFVNPAGQTVMSCLGSGTIITSDGLILTNSHVVLPRGNCRSDKIAVALTIRPNEPPVPKYYARVVASNIGWDLAILQITETIDSIPVNRATLALPFAEIGNSDEVRLDETTIFVGYAPSQDGLDTTAQVITGTIAGFTSESRVGDRAWLKTRSALPGAMTGGAAYDQQGRLIGIPTVEPSSSGLINTIASECRRLQDSNGDGRVDDQDLCIPTSGFINAIRPINLAQGLILASRVGLNLKVGQPQSTQVGGTPIFNRLLFSTGVDLAGMPANIVTSAPSGISSLYLFFDYIGMTDGMIYELRVLRDGLLDPTFSLAPATWSGGPTGLWYLGSTAQIWPNGNYEFLLFIEGVRIAEATIAIGGAAAVAPVFSNILFGVLTPDGELASTGNILPVANVVNAEFVFNGMEIGMPWRQVWYYDGVQIAEATGLWDITETNGKRSISASGTDESPLQPGRYRLELYAGDRLAGTADFVMAGAQVELKTEIFNNFTFASELTPEPGGVIGTTFPAGLQKLYALYDWRDIALGTPVTWRWTIDDKPLFENTQAWTGELNGSRGWVGLETTGQLPDGSYTLEIIIAGVVKGSATAEVGIGQLPVALFTTAEGINVRGRIIDAETQEGIHGAMLIILKPDFDVRDFTWQMIEVFDVAYTDLDGYFFFPKLLPRKETYSIIIIAKGYLGLATDGLRVEEDAILPIQLRLEMNRD
jgi:S1-C subfamily serine protease